jgi:hypothetical protein
MPADIDSSRQQPAAAGRGVSTNKKKQYHYVTISNIKKKLTSMARAITGDTFMQLHMRYTVMTMAYPDPEPTYSRKSMKNLWFLLPTQLFIHGQ